MRGRAGVALIGASFGLAWITALLGPSVAAQGLPGGGPLPLSLGLDPSPWLVVGLLAVSVVIGAAGSLLAWSAVRRGWSPSPTRLLAGGLVAIGAFVLVPPVTSDDVYSYAAYGRMVVLGHDPYTTTPDDLRDPVTDRAGAPWRDSPSIYGPVATAEQALVMKVAGTSVRLGIWLLAFVGAAAAAATAVLLDRLAVSAERRRRAALLFGLNPLVVVPLVGGAHVDALLVLAIVGAVALVRWAPLLAGVVIGLGGCVKLTGALVAAGLAWWLRGSPRKLAAFAAAAAAVAIPAYAAVGGFTALEQAQRASRFVSFAVPWRRLADAGASRTVIGLLALAVVAALALLLYRALPGGDAPERVAAVVVLAWLLGATYLLPWYDAWAWCLLALLVWSRWDVLLLWHTTVLSLAYLPGRTVPMPVGLEDALSWTRRTAAPVLLGAAVLVAIRWATSRARGTPGR